MPKPRVFISHSTSELPANERCVKLRDALHSTLRRRGWEVFLDQQRIKPGDKWRTDIVCNLAEAQAGIILFNDRAASGSDWVLAEALILCFRKSVDPNFQVVPVLLDGRDPSDTCFKKYEPFQLNEIQAMSDDKSLTPEKLADLVASQLDRRKAGSPQMSQWVQRVFELLEHVNVDRLWLAAEQLHLRRERVPRAVSAELYKQHLCRAVVELMHHKRPSESISAFRELLYQLDTAKADLFSKHLQAKWVENETAEILLCASRKPEQLGVLTVNTTRQEEIEQYLRRAQIELSTFVKTFTVAGAAGEGHQVILHKIENTIRTEFFGEGRLYVDENGKELPLPMAVAKQLEEAGDVAICALPKEFAKDAVLKKLRADYPRIIFLVQVGDAAEHLTRFEKIGGKPLTPPLDWRKNNELIDLKNRLSEGIKAKFFS